MPKIHPKPISHALTYQKTSKVHPLPATQGGHCIHNHAELFDFGFAAAALDFGFAPTNFLSKVR